MKPEELVALINKALEPYAKSIGDLDAVMVDIQRKMEKSVNVAELTKVEVERHIDKLFADIQIDMAQNPDKYRGLPGPQGEQGLVGQRGEKGKNGSDGQPGPQGKQGIPGAQGKQGERGETGYPGPQGEKGIPGNTGLEGSAGKQGEPGQRGAPGSQGEMGPIGKRGEKGDQGLPGQDGKDGPQGERGLLGEQGPRGEKGMPGEQGDAGPVGATGGRGERGFMQVVRQWEPGEHIIGSQVTHKGSTWQATYSTSKEPGHKVRAWELISDGIQIEKEGDHTLIVRSGSGTTLEYPDLRGAKGDRGKPGEGIVTHRSYDETHLYRAGLDDVKHNGSVWRAMKPGILHAPGSKKSEKAQQWINITHRGPKGPPGKDADEEAMAERLEMRMMIRIDEVIAEAINSLTDPDDE